MNDKNGCFIAIVCLFEQKSAETKNENFDFKNLFYALIFKVLNKNIAQKVSIPL